jgi:NADH:ubiquinone oxidoreductase subunit F (NADH-binding)/NADH:ubiquinone oxidoreductase subunit E
MVLSSSALLLQKISDYRLSWEGIKMNVSAPLSEGIIREVLSRHTHDRTDLLPVLDELNSLLGHLSRPALESVAQHFKLPLYQVYGPATFYSMWRVAGEPVDAVQLCDDGPCHLARAVEVGRALERAGAKVERTSCLGQCNHGPVVIADSQLYRRVMPGGVRAILAGEETEPTYAADEIIGIEVEDSAHSILRNVGAVDPRSLDEALATGAYRALRKALTSMTPEQVVDEITSAGLLGRGGAGFPNGVKVRFTAAAARSGDGTAYVVCNADESEPGTFKDRILMEGDPHRLLEGMAIAAYAVGAHQGYIYIRGEYIGPAELVEGAIHDAEAAGFLGQNVMDTGFDFPIHIHRGAGAYICGEETALLESLEGKRGEPRLRPPYPTSHGLFGKPTLVDNVETMTNLPDIILYGADWYRETGTQREPGARLYPVSGHVKRRGCLEMPLGGMTVRQVIDGPAGGMRGEAPFKACHLGGAAGAIVGPEFLDVPLDIASCRAAGAPLGAGAITVLDANTCILDYLRVVADFFHFESCGKCTPCRVGTERYTQILSDLTHGRGTPQHLDELVHWGQVMKDSSFCGLGQTAPTAALSALTLFRDEFEAHAHGECPLGVCHMKGAEG